MKNTMAIFLLLTSCATSQLAQSNQDPVSSVVYPAADTEKPSAKRVFFAFDNGLTQIDGFEQKAAVLQELGYNGISWRPGKQLATIVESLDKHNLKIVSTYAGCKVDAENPSVDRHLYSELDLYQKHGTDIWLFMARGEGANDEIATQLIQEVADQASKAGLRVVLYPHTNNYVETVEDALRLVKIVNRPNVGITFNLCHFLKTDSEQNLEAVLKKSAPHLMQVTLNGADSGNTKSMSWNRLIQPLGDGTFDNAKVLKILDKIGFEGPIGLQCFGVKGDDSVNLKKSMTAWQELNRSSP